MASKYFPLLLIVASGATYHACQKIVSRQGDAWTVLTGVYFIAFVTSLLMSAPWKVPAGTWLGGMWSIGPAGLGLGLACVGIELGVLLAYQWGWKVTSLSQHTSVAHSVTMLLLGVLAFRESVSPSAAAGLAMAAMGVGLMHWK